MEVVVVIAILVVLGLILGISLASAAQILVGLMIIVLGLMMLFFGTMGIVLLMTKGGEGELDGFGKVREEGYETAFYRLKGGQGSADSEEERLPNIFPAENIMRGYIYTEGRKRLRVFRGRRRSFVIDRHSTAIILFGLILTAPSLVYVIIEFIQLRSQQL